MFLVILQLFADLPREGDSERGVSGTPGFRITAPVICQTIKRCRRQYVSNSRHGIAGITPP